MGVDNMFDSDALLSLLDEFSEEAEKEEEKRKLADELAKASREQHQITADIIKEKVGSDLDSNEVTSLINDIMEDLKDTPDAAKKLFVPKSIDDYSKEEYSDPQLKEISKGIEHHVDVDLYDSVELSARQMREIRYGLERGLDVSYYTNKYFRESQMREIRLGLQDKLDVEKYARIIYSPTDMREKRIKLFNDKYMNNLEDISYDYDDEETGIHIYVKPGLMEAGIVLKKQLPEKFTQRDLLRLMNTYDITEGFIGRMLPANLANLPLNTKITVMNGISPSDGVDGYYEYKFPREKNEKPKILEDGSVDYIAPKQYMAVNRGDVVAIYHQASLGSEGLTVTGTRVPAKVGKELPKLECNDIILSRDQVTYLSKKNGFVSYQGDDIKIMDYLTFDKDITLYDGRINYTGTVKINGSVQENAEITATGDIFVNGFVGPAKLKAGGSIIVKGGLNGDDRGSYVAKENVIAGFIENASIEAGGNIETGYILNSSVACEGTLVTTGRKSLICGGIIEAKKGITTGTVGSKAGTRTELICGDEYDDWNERSNIDELMKQNEEESIKIRQVLDMLLQKMGSTVARTDEKFLKLQSTLNSKKDEREALQKELDILMQKRKEMEAINIMITKDVYNNTFININGNKLKVSEARRSTTFVCEGRSIVVK